MLLLHFLIDYFSPSDTFVVVVMLLFILVVEVWCRCAQLTFQPRAGDDVVTGPWSAVRRWSEVETATQERLEEEWLKTMLSENYTNDILGLLRSEDRYLLCKTECKAEQAHSPSCGARARVTGVASRQKPEV